MAIAVIPLSNAKLREKRVTTVKDRENISQRCVPAELIALRKWMLKVIQFLKALFHVTEFRHERLISSVNLADQSLKWL